MVLIHCKYKGEEHSFLYDTTVEINVKDLIKELVEVHNLRLRLQRLKSEGDDLASHGPCKPPDKQGLDEDIQAEADGISLPMQRSLKPLSFSSSSAILGTQAVVQAKCAAEAVKLMVAGW